MTSRAEMWAQAGLAVDDLNANGLSVEMFAATQQEGVEGAFPARVVLRVDERNEVFFVDDEAGGVYGDSAPQALIEAHSKWQLWRDLLGNVQ